VIEQLETVGNQLAEKHLSSARAFILDAITNLSSHLGSIGISYRRNAILPCCLTPMIGVVLPQRWQGSGRLPMKVSLRMPGRRSRSSQGMSVIRPHPEQTALRWGVALVHRLPDTPGSPVGIDFHGRHHRTEIRVISFERADPSSGTVRAHIAEHGYPGAR
jgi:hypothetical protein